MSASRHEDLRTRAARWFGLAPAPAYQLSAWTFLRLLGLVYLAAFLSLAVQLDGLIGARGILPAAEFLSAVRQQVGPERWWLVPTLAWISPSDGMLRALGGLGTLAALALLLDVAPAIAALVAWVTYLSLASVCREFLWFQWDSLLLEAGFLALWLAPWRLRPSRGDDPPPPRLIIALLWWLLFRLMFSSGVVKLTSGDPTWRTLTALQYHYETQPLPDPLSWTMQQLPAWCHRMSTAYVFVAELGVVWALFGPRRLKRFAARSLMLFQALLMATGNYAFFNWLTVALCVPALDKDAWPLRRPAWWRSGGPTRGRFAPRPVLVGVAAIILILSAVPMLRLARMRPPRPLAWLAAAAAPWHLVNHYGLFAVMTTQRPEIILEGSADGRSWRTYEFRYKPGDLRRMPPFVAPHQPRLDWQLWFAALSRYQDEPWFMQFCRRLLEGSPAVRRLLARDPFPDAPPRYLRAFIYQYHFTRGGIWPRDGVWWQRKLQGPYCPVLSLSDDDR